jgi:hypothetical protein
VPRLIDESLDRALRACRAVARDDENVALVFAQLGDRRAKAGWPPCSAGAWWRPRSCAAISRRLPEWTVATVADRGAAALRECLRANARRSSTPSRFRPAIPSFRLLAKSLRTAVPAGGTPAAADVHAAFARARATS